MLLSTKNESPNSEDFYTAIFDSIGSPILIIDSQTTAILDANEAACKFYGYPHTDFIQKKILDLAAIPSEEAWQRIQKIAAGEITRMTRQHRLANGETRTVEVDLGTKKLGDKQMIIATLHDITEREQTKEKLQTSEEQYHSLFSNMSEGFAVHEIIQDETGRVVDFRFLDANQAYGQHTGQKPEDIIGHTICETISNADSAMIERYGNVALTGKSLDFEYFSKTFNRHIRVRSFRPQPNQFASIFEDITERKRDTEKLKESEENYRLLFQNMREGFSLYEVVTDENGQAVDARILAANEAYEKHTGLKPSEVIDKTLLEVKPDTDKHQLEPFFRVAQSGVPASIEFFSNGFQRYFHTTIFSPKHGHFATIVEDITDRKQAEAALQAAHDELEQRVQERTAELHESEQKYMALFKKAAVPAALTKMPEGVFVEVNEAFQGTFGYMNDEIYGKTSVDIGMVKPEERGETYIELERHGFVQNNEKHFRTKAGEKRDCLINVNPVSFNGRDFVITTIADITERKQAEQQLWKLSNLLADGQKIAHLGSFEYIAATRQTVWSEEEFRIYGYDPDQPSPDYDSMLAKSIHPEDSELLNRTFVTAMENGINYELEHRIVRPDGTVLWVYDHAYPYFDQTGQLIRYVGVTLDITDRKKASQELIETNTALERALRTKDEFMAAMSHELRTPLTGIMGMTEILQNTALDSLTQKQIGYLTAIQKSSDRLLGLINNLLEFTQLQSSTVALNIFPCTLVGVCQTALQKITPASNSKQQQMRFNFTPSEIILHTDEKQLFKVLILLLDNANKFTPRNGEIGIEVMGRPDDKLVDITVWDTGIGISDKDLPRLFTPFTQLDASLAREYDGTGLGLALVKSITNLLNGSVSVQSTLGKGSRFTVTLPWKSD